MSNADGIVNEDGSITVPPDQAARLGSPLRPGSHLSLVRAPERTLADALEETASWQKERGVSFTEEEAIRLAVEGTRETRRHIAEQASGDGA